ncbi:sensor histidine kinase [Roseivirga spongicola]|uniref:sensor histidine kinase n=1 Tax=Roseivirga spongicola TaxID=333140 RepID=UPI002AC96599|nr:histidine kinase [Roseivirga spongicola]WPZ11525.1 histidine kinase [Roseivirga spongicola]
MPKLFRLLFFVVIGVLFLFYLFYADNNALPHLVEDANLYGFTVLAASGIGFGIITINGWLNKQIPWRSNVLGRFVAGLSLDFVFLGVTLLLFGWLANVLGLIDYDMFPEDMFIRQIELKLIVLSLITMFIVTLVEFNRFSYNEFTVGQIRKLKSQRKQLELQFEALKSQLSPHYLFNSMNTISSLVYRDPNIAENFIRNLAETFNYVLNTREVQLVKLEEEIEALKDYGYLLTIRYADAISLNIEVDATFNKKPVPPLTLQLLVENAVKHNVISSDEPLKIHIRATEEEVIVLNNKTGTPSQTASHKVGLDNIKNRYAFFTPKEISIENNDYFEVRLPMLSA